MKLKLNDATAENALDPTWHTYRDDGDGEPIEFLVAPWTRSMQEQIERNLANKKYIDDLAIDWARMPKIRGKKKDELRLVVTAHMLLHGMNNVEAYDSDQVFKRGDDVDIYNKVMAYESLDLSGWILAKAREGGAKVVEEEAGN
jgi:hypothetical protein